MNKINYKNRKYHIEEYDKNWFSQFNEESKRLVIALQNEKVSIEHIGSTSVPGLASKPTIDILVVIDEIEKVSDYEESLADLGYKYLGEYVMKGSRLFVKEKDNQRLVNLHFFEMRHPHITNMIGLRDYFRSHPEIVKEYSDLKFKLAKEYPNDYASYRKYKDAWMNELKSKIRLSI